MLIHNIGDTKANTAITTSVDMKTKIRNALTIKHKSHMYRPGSRE